MPVVAWEECDDNSINDCDSSEKFVRMVKGGSGSRSRKKGKVSSVWGVGYGSEASNNNKVTRSKSIGSGSGLVRGSWVKMQPHQTEHGFGRRKVRLKKSKSMGVLQGSALSHYSENNNKRSYNNNNDDDVLVIGSAMANLVVTDKLEKKMVEKALVKLHDEGGSVRIDNEGII